MSQALYRKWRPQTWDEVVGQDHVVQTLRNAVRAGRVAHAYLFAGPRGTGKTTTARLLAKAVNCLAEDPADRPCNACDHCLAVNEGRFLDLIEIDAASNTSVEDVRDLRDRIHFAPSEGRYKVYIIDEVHMLSTAAFNALLKTLEEPPAHAIFVLATTEVHKVPATVLSRCQRHEFRRLPVAVMVDHLRARAQAEGLEVEGAVLDLVARQATGSLRDAISLLDQLASLGGPVTLEQAHQVLGTAAGEVVRQVVEALAEGQAAAGLEALHRGLDGGADPRQLARQVVDYLRGVLLVRLGNAALVEAPAEVRAEMARRAERLSVPALLRALEAFGRAAHNAAIGWHAALPLEMALVEALGLDAPPGERAPASASAAAAAAPAAEGTPASPPPRPASRPSPPPSQKAAANPETATEAASEVTFQTVLGRWREVLEAAYRLDPRTQALLNSCRPLGLQSGVLVLGFASDILREKMEAGDRLDLARQALAEVLGVPLPVRCVLTEKWRPGEAEEEAPPPMEEGGMVATAVRDLGGRVVEHDPTPEAPEPGGATPDEKLEDT